MNILDEREPARRPLVAVQAHDDALDFAALAERLVYLLFGSEEGQVANVQRAGADHVAAVLVLRALRKEWEGSRR